MTKKFGQYGTMKVVWKKYRTAKSLVKRFFGPMGMSPTEIKEYPEMLIGIRAMGMWAFVTTDTKIPVVHYWHVPDVDKVNLAFMLGHELGHVSGKRFKSHRNSIREEYRADEYGLVACTVFKKILG